MTRARTLATFLSAFLAVGNGFVLVAPRVTPPESSRPEQAAQAPAEVGGPGTSGAFSLSGAGEAKAVPSAEDRATCSPDSCPRLHAIVAVEVSLLLTLLHLKSLPFPTKQTKSYHSSREEKKKRANIPICSKI